MPSTYSPRFRFELPATGERSATWGTMMNLMMGTLLEDALSGVAAIDVTAGHVTLTDNDGAADEARCAILSVTGTPGAARNVVAPLVSKTYLVLNHSDSALTVKSSGTTGVTLPAAFLGQPASALVVCDGTEFRFGLNYFSLVNTPNRLMENGAVVLPSGTILPYAGAGSIPNGFLACDGSAVSRTAYGDLWAVIGTTYGAGDGSTTFNVPDLRGRVLAGTDGGSGRLYSWTTGTAGGTSTHTLATGELPSHTHVFTTDAGGLHQHTTDLPHGTSAAAGAEPAIIGSGTLSYATSASGSHTHTGTTNPTGSGTAHNITQPTLVAQFMIRV